VATVPGDEPSPALLWLTPFRRTCNIGVRRVLLLIDVSLEGLRTHPLFHRRLSPGPTTRNRRQSPILIDRQVSKKLSTPLSACHRCVSK
jgi:hypothetical protein